MAEENQFPYLVGQLSRILESSAATEDLVEVLGDGKNRQQVSTSSSNGALISS